MSNCLSLPEPWLQLDRKARVRLSGDHRRLLYWHDFADRKILTVRTRAPSAAAICSNSPGLPPSAAGPVFAALAPLSAAATVAPMPPFSAGVFSVTVHATALPFGATDTALKRWTSRRRCMISAMRDASCFGERAIAATAA